MRLNTIQAILRGLTPVRAQTVGNMTIVPLVSDMVDDTIASPNVLEMETPGYGTVIVYNTGTEDESGLTISPLGSVIMTSKAAQNHAVPSMKLIRKGKSVRLDNAACVQEHRGGYIRKDRYQLMLLPLILREDALETRKVKSHGKLWPSIRSFNKSLGLQHEGHLEHFVHRYRQEMDEFVAQFEVLPNQVGAIVLVDGVVAGIERCPNYRFFKVMWEPLIRECYGSYSLQKAIESGFKVPPVRVALSTSRVRSLADIRKALVRAALKEEAQIKKTINAFIKNEFKVEAEERKAGFKVETLTNSQFKGQMVRKSQVPLMFSFVKTKDWLADPNQEKFAQAKPFRM
ncbi:MAG: hypothetical protein GY846_04505 [Deltaproteobacteria bacterium]|nr:hypothetical protein [Deltaproteobacteria bacterium]